MKHRIPLMIVLTFIVIFAAASILVPYLGAQSEMPGDGTLTVQYQSDGSFLLNWPEAEGADCYFIEILQSESRSVLYSTVSNNPQGIIIPEIPETDVHIRVNSLAEYSVFGFGKMRCGANALEVPVRLDMPEVIQLQWTPEPENDTVDVKLQTDGADACYVYRILENGEYTLLQILSEDSWVLPLGEGGILPVPEADEIYHLGFAACREMPGVNLQGNITAQMEINRQDLLGRALNVTFSRDDNRFILTWDETKGERYEVQCKDWDGDWETVCQIGLHEERRYITDVLPKFREYAYRVVAVGGQTMEGSTYAAVSDEVQFSTGESPLYATVWPVMDMDAYFDARRSKVTDRVEVGKAYCVVDERNGMFGIRVGDQICYIDSNYCMINLPEYMGDLCSYQIANSNSSLYMVHEFEIPDVTGVVTSGYAYVHQADGSYLVPLLYPTAKKLVAAAQNAIARGYKLKIYDSFRPQLATREIYNRTLAILNSEIPKETYTGKTIVSLQLPEPGEDSKLTYRQVMTNDKYGLTSFLAKGTSRHNLGVALDLTLEDLGTDEELRMQTSMHDLSWYSVTDRNNAKAQMLASIMQEAGFAPLASEWWHFQDDASKKELALTAVWNGVSAEGWVCDDTGWKYRDAYGVIYRNQTVKIGETEYDFDENGYMIGEEIAFG